MVLLIIAILLGIGVAFLAIVIDWKSILNWFLGIFLFLGISIIFGFLALIPSLAIDFESEYELNGTTQIIAIKDKQNINGSCYLHGGYVDEELYYYYAKETEKGIETEKIDADSCYIIYSEEQPKIEKYKAVKFKNWYDYIWAIPCKKYYKIYVPKGTVTNEFNIDLE